MVLTIIILTLAKLLGAIISLLPVADLSQYSGNFMVWIGSLLALLNQVFPVSTLWLIFKIYIGIRFAIFIFHKVFFVVGVITLGKISGNLFNKFKEKSDI